MLVLLLLLGLVGLGGLALGLLLLGDLLAGLLVLELSLALGGTPALGSGLLSVAASNVSIKMKCVDKATYVTPVLLWRSSWLRGYLPPRPGGELAGRKGALYYKLTATGAGAVAATRSAGTSLIGGLTTIAVMASIAVAESYWT